MILLFQLSSGDMWNAFDYRSWFGKEVLEDMAFEMVFERDTGTPFDVVCGAGDGAHTRDYSAIEVPTSSRSAQRHQTRVSRQIDLT